MTTRIEAAAATDLASIKAIAVDTGLFEPDQVGAFDEMMAGYLDRSLEGHEWIVWKNDDAEVAGAAYYAPEPFSDRLWNLYFLGVDPGHHSAGIGTALIHHVEVALLDKGEEEARVLIVETSGLPGFEATRTFYTDRGFDEEARIREFYGPGDDKIVFWKLLVSDDFDPRIVNAGAGCSESDGGGY